MGCQSPLGCYEVQKQKKAKWARLSPSQNVGVEERKSFKKQGVRFPHKASLQHVLSKDTALAISPFFLLHYLLPVAPIACLLWFKDWWSILILRNLGIGLRRTLWIQHRRLQPLQWSYAAPVQRCHLLSTHCTAYARAVWHISHAYFLPWSSDSSNTYFHMDSKWH